MQVLTNFVFHMATLEWISGVSLQAAAYCGMLIYVALCL